jgi:hypothetical protein
METGGVQDHGSYTASLAFRAFGLKHQVQPEHTRQLVAPLPMRNLTRISHQISIQRLHLLYFLFIIRTIEAQWSQVRLWR